MAPRLSPSGRAWMAGGLVLGLAAPLATPDAPTPWYHRPAPWHRAVVDPAFIRFTEQTGADNPFDGLSVLLSSAPALADLDDDGDADALVGRLDGTFVYFKNTGTATDPVFVERTGADNPLDGVDVGGHAAPAFADLDGDGDLDLVSGSGTYTLGGGTFAYFENIGTATNPVFVERTGADNPLDGFDVGAYSSPAFADLDGDGDLDLASGNGGYAPNTGVFFYFENTGTDTAPAFVERTGPDNPFDGFSVSFFTSNSTPAFADVDGDGDFDMVSGNGTYFALGGMFFYFENTGTAAVPDFVERTGPDNPFDALSSGSNSTSAFADLDGDGDADLISGDYFGDLHFYLNETSTVQVHLAPMPHPIVLPPEGGTLPIKLELANLDGVEQTFEVWTELTLPGGQVLALRGPLPVTLGPGERRMKTMTQPIPATAPSGEFRYDIFVGTFPEPAFGDGFTFTKAAAAPHPRLARAIHAADFDGALTSRCWPAPPGAATRCKRRPAGARPRPGRSSSNRTPRIRSTRPPPSPIPWPNPRTSA